MTLCVEFYCTAQEVPRSHRELRGMRLQLEERRHLELELKEHNKKKKK